MLYLEICGFGLKNSDAGPEIPDNDNDDDKWTIFESTSLSYREVDLTLSLSLELDLKLDLKSSSESKSESKSESESESEYRMDLSGRVGAKFEMKKSGFSPSMTEHETTMPKDESLS